MNLELIKNAKEKIEFQLVDTSEVRFKFFKNIIKKDLEVLLWSNRAMKLFGKFEMFFPSEFIEEILFKTVFRETSFSEINLFLWFSCFFRGGNDFPLLNSIFARKRKCSDVLKLFRSCSWITTLFTSETPQSFLGLFVSGSSTL
ncbi:MAG: hypothetical protein K2Q18_01525, partial [Bdellovibrionales bacterium]|nr:hypothetical protein [Bdellovibrionales bacterium]